jgi:hypothetical protein
MYKDKYCRGCRDYHSISAFSPRRDSPNLFYDYCDQARKELYVRRANKNSYQQEIKELREKAKSFRKLTYDQALEIGKRNKAGESHAALASEFNVSTATIGKAVRRPGIYK